MKITSNRIVSAAARAVSLCIVSTVFLATCALAQNAPAPGGKGDYLVLVGKRTIWASQATRERAAIPTPHSSGGRRDYLVTSGKRTVWASTLNKPTSVAHTHPSCRDYLVQDGKRAVLASTLPGKKVPGDSMSLCCVNPGDCKMSVACCTK